MIQVLPSLLCQTTEQLRAGFERWQGVTAMVHIDFADGQFVANRLPSPAVAGALPNSLAWQCHLMVKQPAAWVDDLLDNDRVDTVVVHVEAEGDMTALAAKVHQANRRFGLAVRPETPVGALREYLPIVDLALLLAVQPGFNGSPFVEAVIDKVRQLRADWPTGSIVVDGGMQPQTISRVVAAGANAVVVGSYLHQGDARQALAELEAMVAA